MPPLNPASNSMQRHLLKATALYERSQSLSPDIEWSDTLRSTSRPASGVAQLATCNLYNRHRLKSSSYKFNDDNNINSNRNCSEMPIANSYAQSPINSATTNYCSSTNASFEFEPFEFVRVVRSHLNANLNNQQQQQITNNFLFGK